MAIILRIISADGRKTITKTLPALPAHLKIPAGAKVEVIDKDTKEQMSLPQYVNSRSGHAGEDGEGSTGNANVTVETVQDWGEAIAWLDMVEQQAPETLSEGSARPETVSSTWYDPGTADSEGNVLGFDKDTLLIGGVVGAGLVAGAFLLTDDKGPKDTVPPVAPTGLDLAAEDDTGSSSTDNITNKTTGLTISGTAEAGAKVELFDGSASIATLTAGPDGKFSTDLDLAAGVHGIRAVATDSAGNESEPSATLVINVDVTAPNKATNLDLATADDTGVSNSDNITNKDGPVTISGSAPAGEIVELFDGALSLGKVTVTANGTFSMTLNLPEATHVITAKISDTAGNAGETSDPLTIVVDRAPPPAVTGLDLDPADDNGASSSDNITSITEDLTFSGIAEAGAIVRLMEGQTVLGSAVAASNGVFVIDIDLAVGNHQIFAATSDRAGNVGPSSAVLDVSVIAPAASSSALDFLDPGAVGNLIA